MNRVLVPRIGLPGEHVQAGPAESHHLLHVQRVPRGARVALSDGHGGSALATLDAVVGGCASFLILEAERTLAAPERVVLLGLPKPAAVEEALTLGAELGATRFLLAEAERTPPGRPRPDRLDRILRSALTQCGRPDLPVVEGPLPLSAALALLPDGPRWVATPGRSGQPTPTPSAVSVAIGPEGGWSPAEQLMLERAGLAPLGLGRWILRTPTAVAAALTRVSPPAP